MRFRLRRDAISYAVMSVIAGAGVYLLASRIIKPHRPIDRVLASSVPKMAGRMRLEEIVRNAGMMSRAEASKYSSSCFAAARRSRNPAVAEPCVGFDLAYLYWRDTAGGPLVADPYFQPAAMDLRFRAAFRLLKPAEAAARIRSVRADTLRAIMLTPRPTDEFGFDLSETAFRPRTAPAQNGTLGALPKD